MHEINFNPTDIISAMNNGLYVVDRDRRIVFWGAAAEKITGYSSEEIVGKHCHDDILCHTDKDGHELCGKEYCPLHRAIVTGTSSDLPIIVFAKSKSGRRVPMKVSVGPLKNSDDEVIGGVEVFTDLTEEYKDLDKAQRIQKNILSQIPSSDDRIEFRTHNLSSDVIGGDFYAVTQLDENRYRFIIADVTGHGLPAGLFTMYLNLIWQDSVKQVESLDEFATIINSRLIELFNRNFYFAAATCGEIDLHENKLILLGAGNPEPFFIHDGKIEKLELRGTPFGMMPDSVYNQKIIDISPGQRLLAFSDGAIEVFDANEELLETGGLLKMLEELDYPQQPLDFNALTTKLLKYSNRIRFEDDMSFLEIVIK